MAIVGLVDEVEKAAALDPLADRMAAVAERVVGNRSVRDVLTGRWLGHPAHPMGVLVPLGCWISAMTLDVIGGKRGRPAADRLVGLGVISAVPVAATGAADWLDTTGAERRVGVVHAGGNSAALLLFLVSWRRRRRGRRASGVLIGFAGGLVAAAAGYLGGHLTYSRGVGVNTTAFQSGPDEWTPALSLDEIAPGETKAVGVGDVALMVSRDPDRPEQVVALEDRCTHRGGPLHEGTIVDGCAQCPWHGSRFDLETGAVRQGPASVPQPAYATAVRDGKVWVRRLETGGLRRTP